LNRREKAENYRRDFSELYKMGNIKAACEKVVQGISELYIETKQLSDLLDNPSDDIRPGFRIEHDACELLRTFSERIGAGENNNPVQKKIQFLESLIQHFPTWRFALNLLAIILFENQDYRNALETARISFKMREGCPFAEHLLQKILKKIIENNQTQDLIFNDTEKRLLLDLTDYICMKPFTNFEVWRTGDVYICCGTWVPVSIGNVFEQSAEEIWNSPVARELRRSVLDGDFKYCNRSSCILIRNGLLIKKSDALKGDLEKYQGLWGITVYKRALHLIKVLIKYIEKHETMMKEGPSFVNLAYDFTCNLSCPSCRDKIKFADSKRKKELDKVRDRVIIPLLPHIHELLLSGDGDPFASPHYRSIMAILDKKRFPNLYLSILTNGVLFTEDEWNRFENIHDLLHSLSVSVDAATPETYHIIRRGGDWKRLMQNLEFLAGLHRKGIIPFFDLNFVVQRRNFREMKAFAELGMRLGVDKVRFARLHNDFESFSPEEFPAENVFDPSNPHYPELLQILSDPIFESENVLYPRITI